MTDENIKGKLRVSWWLCLVSYVLVAVLICFQTLLKEPASTELAGITMLWIGIKLAPWALCIIAFLRPRPNGFILLCFASLLYFVFAGVEATGSHPSAIWARFEVLALVVVFISAMMFARWQKKLDAFGQGNEN